MQKKFIVMLAATMLMAVPVCSFAAIVNDEVTSAKIREATTGSTSQDTNSGNGVKTNHIVDTAITTAKIKDGAVTSSKLGFNCASGQMLLFNGTAWVCSAPVAGPKGDTGATGSQGPQGIQGLVGPAGPQGEIGLNSVTNDKLADGAVTDSKIAGISADKISGAISIDKLATYSGVKVVHAGPSNDSSTFNSISAALNSINDTSETNRFAILVMPGNYVETGTLSLKPFVDIIGQDKINTTIKSDGIYTDSALLANITIESTWLALNGGNTIKNCRIINTDATIFAGNVKIEDSYVGSITIETYSPIDPETITLNNITTGSIYSRMNGSTKSLLISNSTITNGTLTFGNVTYVNSTFNSGLSFEEYGGEVTVKLIGCRVTADLTTGYIPIGGSNAVDVEIDNSVIESVGGDRIFHFTGQVSGPTGTVKIGNSKLLGSLYTRYNAPGRAKLINCHDGNYDSIQNGIY